MLPEVQAKVAFGLQCRIKHALAGHDLPSPNLFTGTVGRNADLIALAEKAEAQLQTGLAGSDDSDTLHRSSLGSKSTFYIYGETAEQAPKE